MILLIYLNCHLDSWRIPLDEPSEEDTAPVPADAPPSGSIDSPAGQRIMAGHLEKLRDQLEQIYKGQFPAEYRRMTRPTSRSRSIPVPSAPMPPRYNLRSSDIATSSTSLSTLHAVVAPRPALRRSSSLPSRKFVTWGLANNRVTRYNPNDEILPLNWKRDKDDVMLSPDIFRRARRVLKFKPGVDLFASDHHHQLPRYFTA